MKVYRDEELIRRCASGDHQAFDLLFKKYARPLTNFIFNILHDRIRSEDIFQDTFIKVFKNSHKFDNRFKFSTWVYRIALNLSINELKKRKRDKDHKFDDEKNGNTILDNLSDFITPEEIIERKEKNEKVKAAVEKLPEKKRIAFVLKFYNQLSYEEIAEITECSIGTVKSRIHYSIEKLQIIAGE